MRELHGDLGSDYVTFVVLHRISLVSGFPGEGIYQAVASTAASGHAWATPSRRLAEVTVATTVSLCSGPYKRGPPAAGPQLAERLGLLRAGIPGEQKTRREEGERRPSLVFRDRQRCGPTKHQGRQQRRRRGTGGRIAPAKREPPVPEGPAARSPGTLLSGARGTATTRGTGRPLQQTVTGGLGHTRGATAWSEGGNTIQAAAGRRGMPIGQKTARDPAVDVQPMAAPGPCVKINRRAAWDLGVQVEDPLAQHPGPRTCQTAGIPFGPSPAKTGSPCCPTPQRPWRWIHRGMRRNPWRWIRLHQSRAGTPAAWRCSPPSKSTNAVAGVPGQLRTPRSGATPSRSLEPPKTPVINKYNHGKIKNSVADSQGLCECFFPIRQPLCRRWRPFCTEPRGRAQERTQLPSGCCAGATGGVPEDHHAPLTFVKIDRGVKTVVCKRLEVAHFSYQEWVSRPESLVTTDMEKAEVLGNFFASVCTGRRASQAFRFPEPVGGGWGGSKSHPL